MKHNNGARKSVFLKNEINILLPKGQVKANQAILIGPLLKLI
jgi:hypothetical protein